MKLILFMLLVALSNTLTAQYLFNIDGQGTMTLASKDPLVDFKAKFKLVLGDGTTIEKTKEGDLDGHAILNFPEDVGYEFNGKDWYTDAEIYVYVDGEEVVNEHRILPSREDGVLDDIYTTGDPEFPRIPIPGDDYPDIHTVWTYNDNMGIHFVITIIGTDTKTNLATTIYEQWTLVPNGMTDVKMKKTFKKEGSNPVPANLEIDDVNEDGIKELYLGVVYNDSDNYPQEYFVYQEGDKLGTISGPFSMKHKNIEMIIKSFEMEQRLKRFYQQVGIENSNNWQFF